MLDLLEQVYLLKNLPLWEIILHIWLLNGFYCHVLSGEFVYTECNFTKSSFSDELDEFIVFKGRRWQLIVLLDKRLYELYQSVSLLQYGLIDFSGSVTAQVITSSLWLAIGGSLKCQGLCSGHRRISDTTAHVRNTRLIDDHIGVTRARIACHTWFQMFVTWLRIFSRGR